MLARPPHILLVEDMAEIALITRKLSERARHQVVWLPSAEEAWEYLQHETPDLVLLDIHLPGMSGLDLCRKVRALPGREDLAIALFTQAQQPDALAESGANYVLTKDMLSRPEAWLARLEEILHCRAASEPLAVTVAGP
jgi:CheY-like chemotaxis protein